MKESTIEEFVLGQQLDALTRVLGLFTDKHMTAEDVFNTLSQAETDAQFVCGFVEL